MPEATVCTQLARRTRSPDQKIEYLSLNLKDRPLTILEDPYLVEFCNISQPSKGKAAAFVKWWAQQAAFADVRAEKAAEAAEAAKEKADRAKMPKSMLTLNLPAYFSDQNSVFPILFPLIYL